MAPTAAAEETQPVAQRAIGQMVPIGLFIRSPLNPRTRFSEADLADLQASISKRRKVLQPLLGRQAKKGAGFVEIVDGERRWHCAQKALMTELPVVIEDLSDADVLEIQLVSSRQRQDLTPMEEARAYRRLVEFNTKKYTIAYLADRMGRDQKYIADRMRLTELIADAIDALNAEAILVGHAEILAKQKPAVQKSLLKFPHGYNFTRGLWQRRQNTFKFDDDRPKTKWDDYRPVSVREFETYVCEHVRFEPEHMAQTAPLEFSETAEAIAARLAKPGRAKKVVPISFETMLKSDAHAKDGERTFCKASWRRADGKHKSKLCEKAVLGVVAAGEFYGKSFDVCVNRDCGVHFAAEKAAKERREKARTRQASGKPEPKEKVESPVAKAKREAKEVEARLQVQIDTQVQEQVLVRGVAKASTVNSPFTGKRLTYLVGQLLQRQEGLTPDTAKPLGEALGIDPRLLTFNANSRDAEKVPAGKIWTVMAASLLITAETAGDDEFAHVLSIFGVDHKALTKSVTEELTAAAKAKTSAPAKTAKKAKKR